MKKTGNLELALHAYVERVLIAHVGGLVSPRDLKRLFPELSPPTQAESFRLEDRAALQATLDDCIEDPGRLPARFWSRFELTVHADVLVLHCAVRQHCVRLSLLATDTRDWWYPFPETFYGGVYYDLWGPLRRSTSGRRRFLASFLKDGDQWVTTPGQVVTSLAGDDLKWLREVQPLPVTHEPGSLASL